MKSLGLATVVLALSCSMARPTPGWTESLEGRWGSEGIESSVNARGEQTYRKRMFDIRDGRFNLVIDVFADRAARRGLFSLEFEGPYHIGQPSGAAPGAVEAEFGHSSWRITPRDPSFVALFEKAHCGSGTWQLGESQDVSRDGCIGIGSISQCPREYDIIAVRDGALSFGERGPAPPCKPEERLSRLSSDRFVRR